MMIKYFVGIAEESLENNSICVKEGEYIRNIYNIYDVEKELLVFVNNIENTYTIDCNKPVRYSILNVSFRG